MTKPIYGSFKVLNSPEAVKAIKHLCKNKKVAVIAYDKDDFREKWERIGHSDNVVMDGERRS